MKISLFFLILIVIGSLFAVSQLYFGGAAWRDEAISMANLAGKQLAESDYSRGIHRHLRAASGEVDGIFATTDSIDGLQVWELSYGPLRMKAKPTMEALVDAYNARLQALLKRQPN